MALDDLINFNITKRGYYMTNTGLDKRQTPMSIAESR